MAILGNLTSVSPGNNSTSPLPIVASMCSFGVDSLERHLRMIFESIYVDKTVDESCKHLSQW